MLFHDLAPDVIESTSREALKNLLTSREILGLAVCEASGVNVSWRPYEPLIEKIEQTDEELLTKVKALVRLLTVDVDSELIATSFRCSLEQASRALSHVAKLIEEERVTHSEPGT